MNSKENTSMIEPKKSQPGGGVRRNSEIDFFRIVFAFAIVIYHGNNLVRGKAVDFHLPFSGGYLAVEFFFMLTGYFCVQKVRRNPDAGAVDALRWTWEKYKRFAIYTIPFAIMSYPAWVIVFTSGFAESVNVIKFGILDILLLYSSGLRENEFLNPLWYLSSVLIVSPIFYMAVLKRKDTFLYTVSPMLTLLIYGWHSVTFGYVGDSSWTGIIFSELLRAWAGMSLGGLVWCGACRLKKVSFSKAGTRLLSIVELVSLALGLTIMYFEGQNRCDFICIGFLAVFVSIVMSEKASIHTLFSPIFSKCAEFTLALYVGHIIMFRPALLLAPNAGFYMQLLLYVVLAIIYTLFLMLIARLIRKIDITGKIKKLVLEEDGASST